MCLINQPFLICCADGYIIDCYGPFPANKNDSSILNYILKTDPDLEKLQKAWNSSKQNFNSIRSR